MHMDSEHAGYLRLLERLEGMESGLDDALTDYADSLRPEGAKIVVRWCEELGDAN